jgi:hypothetical protein
VSCWDLLDQSEARTRTRLRQVFLDACHYLPCVLLFRHLSALESHAQLQAAQSSRPSTAVADTLQACLNAAREHSRANHLPSLMLVASCTAKEHESLSRALRSVFFRTVTMEVCMPLTGRGVCVCVLVLHSCTSACVV